MTSRIIQISLKEQSPTTQRRTMQNRNFEMSTLETATLTDMKLLLLKILPLEDDADIEWSDLLEQISVKNPINLP
jgi:hypothetical protein